MNAETLSKYFLFAYFFIIFLPEHYAHAKEEEEKTPISFEEINEAFNIQLFSDDCLWDDEDMATAKRMKLPRESKTSTQASFRHYPSAKTIVLGIRPYSLAMYSRDGKPTYISAIFINKGDYAPYLKIKNNKSMNELEKYKLTHKAFSEFKKILKKEGDIIRQNMTDLLGESKRTTFGQGHGMKDRVYRWDWNDHAFLLAITRDEYISLKIMSTEQANANGKALHKTTDSELRAKLKQAVQRLPNGDVFVSDIPMVSQGPKGYCVPATWERYLRYMDIPADMYSLAMAGGSGKGGGTSFESLIEATNQLVSRHGRRIRSFKSNISISSISRYIDDGLALMWCMYVVPQLNKQISQRSKKRPQTPDMSKWIETIKPYRKEAREISKDTGHGHVCMIIGYNKETKEIAISDSWGANFEKRWITTEEAEAIDHGNFLIITW
ncbi:hypothetical protein ACFLS1_05380 [Verrucomicrobiota bacterium]